VEQISLILLLFVLASSGGSKAHLTSGSSSAISQQTHASGSPGKAGSQLHHQPTAEELDKMSPEQRQKELESLSPQQRAEAEKHLKAYERLSEEERTKLHEQYRMFRQLPPAKQNRIRQAFRHFQKSTPERQQAMRSVLDELTPLTPEQRGERLSSPEFKRSFSKSERRTIEELLTVPKP
jgi:uncharacterized protein YktA (UPF0223 family)